ncbi:hypothetical protein BDR04DRAFT_1104223, partial [Suillus decipiens]
MDSERNRCCAREERTNGSIHLSLFLGPPRVLLLLRILRVHTRRVVGILSWQYGTLRAALRLSLRVFPRPRAILTLIVVFAAGTPIDCLLMKRY